MRELDALVEQKTGLSIERAMRIDEVNLYNRLGEETFWKLSRTFYAKVYNDEEEKWFKNIFKNRSMEEAIQNQVEFFMQRMGGPAYFSKRKGHPALIGRHMPFNMGEKAAVRWLHHMKASLEEVKEIDEDSRSRMMDYFTHTAYFLSLGVTMQQSMRGENQD
ncbi:MAG TPA: truncated hemoglobin family protein [Leptospiraceae bacterium]|nr:truncated hemoglobin family protein [Leptospiraceae bacterium]HMY65137.1 truncated hemoglobin family protein [Leptospiraceae bacterium]HMZ57218.1 truncated hemoglobin family protein [Leptospiraceae bacterium]HNF12505.1 truncated hemoglobin family protein [Leptospiraceae bacterium]HNF23121.1 truncated hemoglobin family protein [Leptospiraceae bacterium]